MQYIIQLFPELYYNKPIDCTEPSSPASVVRSLEKKNEGEEEKKPIPGERKENFFSRSARQRSITKDFLSSSRQGRYPIRQNLLKKRVEEKKNRKKEKNHTRTFLVYMRSSGNRVYRR